MSRFRTLRVEAGFSQFQLRLATAIHQSKISLIENNLIEPTEDEKQRLAAAIGLNVDEIFPKKEEDNMERNIKVGISEPERLQAACDKLMGVNVDKKFESVDAFRSLRAAYTLLTNEATNQQTSNQTKNTCTPNILKFH